MTERGNNSVITWTIAHQAPVSKGFSRQEDWSGLPFPFPRDLLDPGIEPVSLRSPASAAVFFTIVKSHGPVMLLELHSVNQASYLASLGTWSKACPFSNSCG